MVMTATVAVAAAATVTAVTDLLLLPEPMNILLSVSVCLLPLFLAEAFAFFILKLKSPKYALAPVLGFFSVLVPGFLISIADYFFNFAPDKIQSIGSLLVYNLFFVALIEETVKFFALKNFYCFLRQTEQMENRQLFMALTLGIAFGVGECIFYLAGISHFSILRPFTAVLLHGACTCVCAQSFFISKSRRPLANSAYFLAKAVVLHGLYNFFVSLGGFFYVFAALILLFSIYSACCKIEK